jgi:DNA-binding SARP family transcriptional activator/tetratricopeptide (TPR) repeat protein
VRFRVLGAVEIERDDGLVVVPGRRRERCLLAVLLLEPGRIVAGDRLCELLWEGNPPEQARRILQSHAARLRADLARAADGAGDAKLVSAGNGYQLRVDPEAVDAHRFRAILGRAATTTEPARREELLRDALTLWRGPALHNAADGWLRERICAELEELRLRAIEDSIDAGLALGRHRELIADLSRLTAAHPFRERLVELQMTALYRAARTAEALDLYARTRARLADELGLEPGPTLAALHAAILRGVVPAAPAPPVEAPVPPVATSPPAAAIRPAQLPSSVVAFTGRTAYLRQLDRLLPDGSGQPTGGVVISAITGAGGVGKTALAVHWAHRVRDRFPDGQLYVNLHGYSPNPPVRAIDALTQFLLALGVAAPRIPAELGPAASMYRSLLADRRVLVVLDNARGPDQIRALLPGTPGCLVLVTSRDRLSGLVARDGAERISLDVLTTPEAHDLLTLVLGPGRVATEPEAAAALAATCANLPLALRIAAANLLDRPGRRIADQVADLRSGDRLSTLEVDGDPEAAVRAVFDVSYAALPPDTRRLFRLFGLLPGPDATVEAAAALFGTSPLRVAPLLDRLTGGHLLTEQTPGRFTFHDLLRTYAAERSRAEDGDTDRATATGRLYDHYLATVDAAVTLLNPGAVRLARERAVSPVTPFADRAAAVAGLDADWDNLIAAVCAAAENGPPRVAWLLANALHGGFWLRAPKGSWYSVAEAGLAAAIADGNVAAQGAAEFSLGDADLRAGQYGDAGTHFERALALSREAAWAEAEAAVLNNLGVVYGQTGRLAPAADHFEQAASIRHRIGNRAAEASSRANVGVACYELGQLERAVEHQVRAVALYRTADDHQGVGIALSNLAETCHGLGRLVVAGDHLTTALPLIREVGDRRTEAHALSLLAAVQQDRGEYAGARELAETALRIARDSGNDWIEPGILNILGTACRSLDRHLDAVEQHDRALTLARETENRGAEVDALIGLSRAYADLDDDGRASADAEQAVTLARSHAYRLREGQGLTALAAARLAAGRVDEAIDRGREALALHQETGHRLGAARTHLLLDRALRRAGRAGEGDTHRAAAAALLAETRAKIKDRFNEATAPVVR